VATGRCNDMVVDAAGRAYVGNFGYDYPEGQMKPAKLARVDPDGTVSAAADELVFPNGSIITPDGKTLIVGETFAGRLTAFDIAADGSLSNRRVWAALPERAVPDGACLDAEGAIWAASPTTNDVIRLKEGGEVLERITADQGVFACMLGGEDRKTLYVLTAAGSDPEDCATRRLGRIEAVRGRITVDPAASRHPGRSGEAAKSRGRTRRCLDDFQFARGRSGPGSPLRSARGDGNEVELVIALPAPRRFRSVRCRRLRGPSSSRPMRGCRRRSSG
jgi:hypothetical protein